MSATVISPLASTGIIEKVNVADDTVRALDNVSVVPSIAATVSPAVIPLPLTYMPALIFVLAAVRVTVVEDPLVLPTAVVVPIILSVSLQVVIIAPLDKVVLVPLISIVALSCA